MKPRVKYGEYDINTLKLKGRIALRLHLIEPPPPGGVNMLVWEPVVLIFRSFKLA